MAKTLPKFLFLVLPPILLIILSFSVTFTYWPEMLNWPWVMSHGFLPFKDFSIIFPPTLPFLIMLTGNIVGFSPLTVHLVGTTLLVIIDLIIILFSYRFTKSVFISLFIGFIAVYFLMAFEANSIYTEQLVAIFALFSFYFQYRFISIPKNRYVVLSGLFMGLVLVSKQSAAYLLPEFLFFLGYLYRIKHYSISQLFETILYFLLPLISLISLIFLIFYRLGILTDFYNWDIKLVFLIPSASQPAGATNWVFPDPHHIILLSSLYLLSLSIVLRLKTFRSTFLFVWLSLSILLVFPHFGFLRLLTALSFFCLLLSEILIGKRIIPLVKIIILSLTVVLVLPIFKKTLKESQTFIDPLVLQVSATLSKLPTDRIFIFNSQEQLYFLSGKLPAVKPWVEQMPWLTSYYDNQFSQSFLHNPPEFVLIGSYQPGEFQPSVLSFVFRYYHQINFFPDLHLTLYEKD